MTHRAMTQSRDGRFKSDSQHPAVLTLDQIQTVALAGLVLFVGYGIRRLLPFLTKYNIPAPVVGGLLVAAFITVSRAYGWTPLAFTTSLQPPLHDRVLHDHRLRREPVAAAHRRAGRADLLRHLDA